MRNADLSCEQFRMWGKEIKGEEAGEQRELT